MYKPFTKLLYVIQICIFLKLKFYTSLLLCLLVGQLLLAKGDLDQASSAFKIVLDGDREHVPALLGQVYTVISISSWHSFY